MIGNRPSGTLAPFPSGPGAGSAGLLASVPTGQLPLAHHFVPGVKKSRFSAVPEDRPPGTGTRRSTTSNTTRNTFWGDRQSSLRDSRVTPRRTRRWKRRAIGNRPYGTLASFPNGPGAGSARLLASVPPERISETPFRIHDAPLCSCRPGATTPTRKSAPLSRRDKCQ